MSVQTAVCASCAGSKKCARCEGTGRRPDNLPGPSVNSEKIRGRARSALTRHCPECLGTGTCQSCMGTGVAS
jgi:hypothetical protein